MSWRDDIARYAVNGDVDGVLRIYDELDSDRRRVRDLNAAYLQFINEIRPDGQPKPKKEVTAKVETYDRAAAARAALTKTLES